MFEKKHRSHPRKDFFLGELEESVRKAGASPKAEQKKTPPKAEPKAVPASVRPKAPSPQPRRRALRDIPKAPKAESKAPSVTPAEVKRPARPPKKKPFLPTLPRIKGILSAFFKGEEKKAEQGAAPRTKREKNTEKKEKKSLSLSLPPLPKRKKEAPAVKEAKPQGAKKEAVTETAPSLKAQNEILSPHQDPSPQGKVKDSLEGMYGVSREGQAKIAPFTPLDWVRYAVLFLCFFGFLFAGYFVFGKLYDYYRASVINTELQNMMATPDLFAEEYLKKASAATPSLTPQDIMNGKELDSSYTQGGYTKEQETLVSKIAQLKAINADTAGWITIDGTVVNYPVVWSSVKNYYLHRDFYKQVLSGGTIYIDARNSPDVTKNRNTVIYGHNMTDGSMFASLHDFSSASLFYNATIQIATQNGIFLYKPFSVHAADAYDNYFETDFKNDSDFVQFCEDMQFMSLYETEYTFSPTSQILTLSTCGDDTDSAADRFAVHALLVKVIR